ncbi:MAG: formylglycine-generating enzyme family protein [Verrucomicrobiota bacterium]|nr:formylglycine-generating enzyme family protein [Verrucomicrobiota bacterium]
MKILFLVCLVFIIGCSEDSQKTENHSSKGQDLPFPVVRKMEISKKEQKRLETDLFKSKFVRINPGKFMMGSDDNETGRGQDELLHEVHLTEPFYISKFETTIHDWNSVYLSRMRNPHFTLNSEDKSLIMIIYKSLQLSPSFKEMLTQTFQERFALLENKEIQDRRIRLNQFEKILDYWNKINEGQRKKIALEESFSVDQVTQRLNNIHGHQIQLPVNQVSYTQAVAYCHKLTEDTYIKGELPSKMIYRLPTEAEWEYACRAGMQGVSGLDDGKSLSGLNANLDGGQRNFIIGKDSTLINRGKLIPVGAEFTRFKPNRWGIYDMHGSVKEWCYDFYGKYSNEDVINPIGPIRGKARVLRGGSFYRTAYECRSSSRDKLDPSWRGSEIGFRVVLGFPLR